MQLYWVLLLGAIVPWSGNHALPVREQEGSGSEYNDDLLEGDIKGFANSFDVARNGRVDDNYLWKYRTIPYVISDDFDLEERYKIEEGIAEYHRKTCIRLVPLPDLPDRPAWMDDYIYITRENSGCWSYVGRLGRGAQQLNLQSPGCMSRGTILHEILHAVGFWHEQSRPDRDRFVTINEDNVEDGKMNNFVVHGWEDATILDQPYDVESVMHYSAYAFAKDKNVMTIIPKGGPKVVLGQRIDFSKIDITKINRLYGCT
ncbi:zinc metalloproteinase nas-4-like [Paramacrobiotus metropolitanus]|uniref:zinc metalloproteinase nas-4-like n=1 Tax=Paramacrobiotus metropolitanus TaxID=2943436 RepID=UPI0024462FB0|nr:zinc metalloproteinase nas-4-like [Paramacrobiotus metropolitanus]